MARQGRNGETEGGNGDLTNGVVPPGGPAQFPEDSARPTANQDVLYATVVQCHSQLIRC